MAARIGQYSNELERLGQLLNRIGRRSQGRRNGGPMDLAGERTQQVFA
jgi:hypothetical protein